MKVPPSDLCVVCEDPSDICMEMTVSGRTAAGERFIEQNQGNKKFEIGICIRHIGAFELLGTSAVEDLQEED